MKKSLIIVLFLLLSCGEEKEELLKGPFVIEKGILYDQETREPITGRRYSFNGSHLIDGYYKNGLKHGPYTEKESTRKKFTTNYKDGLEHGERKEYYFDGQLRRRENYKEGVLHGPYEWFYKNGQLGSRSHYLNGKEHGQHIGYDENGTLSSKGQYIEGKREGYWLETNIDGNFLVDNENGDVGWGQGTGTYNKGVRKGPKFPDQEK